MTRFIFKTFFAVWLLLAAGAPAARPAAEGAPDFNELRDLLRTNLPGLTDAEFNRVAVEGLLTSLQGKAMLVTDEAGPVAGAPSPRVGKSTVLDDGVAYLRVARVSDGLATEVSGAYERLTASNKVKGVVLDLRFADGDDYAAAAATADLFAAKQRRLLDWGKGIVESKEKTNALPTPVAVLVNRETGGAAEALAAALREAGAGLILGSPTAGRAAITREFALKNGQRLRVVTAPVKTGNGEALSPAGVKPDILVTVSVGEEKAYLADPFNELLNSNLLAATSLSDTNTAANGTNRVRRRISEADLVRARRDGVDLDLPDAAPKDNAPEQPVVRDPVLARALDVLKGLALLRQFRAN